MCAQDPWQHHRLGLAALSACRYEEAVAHFHAFWKHVKGDKVREELALHWLETVRPLLEADLWRSAPILELHDVRDIIIQLQDFSGTEVELVSDSDTGRRILGARKGKPPPFGEEELVTLLRRRFPSFQWRDVYSVDVTPNQQLLINHTPEAQEQIREFLETLRAQPLVSVSARFLPVEDDFLREGTP